MSEFSKENTTKFLMFYKKLEEIQSKNPALYDIYKQANYKKVESFRSFRNLLSHNESALEYPAIVSDAFLRDIENTVRRLSLKANDISVKISKIFTATLEDSILELIKKMNEFNYSHIPVLNSRGAIEYVITEKSIISILASGGDAVVLTEKSKVKDYLSFFEVNHNKNERMIFVGKNELAFKVENKLGKISDEKKTSVAFVTEDGDKNQAVLGMITAWEFLKF